MSLLIIILLLVLILYRATVLAIAIRKRARLMRKTSRICKERGYKLTRVRNPYASFLKKSSSPDILVETPETLYCVRLITCIMKRRYYHFASEKYCVKVKKVAYAIAGFIGIFGRVHTDSFVMWKKVVTFPPLEEPKTDKNVCRVWLFNPSPLLISRRNNKGAIEDAFNCSDIFGAVALDGRKFLEVLQGKLDITDRE